MTRSQAPSGWDRRVVRTADLAGGLCAILPLLLGAYLMTDARVFEVVTYALCVLAVLPVISPFLASLKNSGANLLLALLLTVLVMATTAAYLRAPSLGTWLQIKGLAATIVWASIYVTVFIAVRSTASVARFLQWISAICVVITVSVYASALFSFGEIMLSRDGTFRAFGPLGDQAAFILVLPALTALVSGNPLLFGVHLGAILLTASRGAMIVLVVGVAVYFLLSVTGKVPAQRWRLGLIASAIAVAAILWVSPASAALRERLLSPSLRLTALEAGMEVVRENPLLGVGFNGLNANRPAVADDWLIPLQAANGLSRASNQYVQTAVDGGVGAVLLLVLFAGFSSRNALRVMRWREAAPELFGSQLWLVSMFVGNQSSLWLLSSASSGIFVFAVAGLSARASILARSQRT